jgi:vacuolar-type H+-ATPase subunit H
MLQEDYDYDLDYESLSLNSQETSLPNLGDRALNHNFQQDLEQLESLLLEGTKIPLTDLVVVDSTQIIDRLESLKTNFPPALSTAIAILKQQQQIITEAENYARNLVNSAEQQASKIIQESSIIRQAEFKAAEIKLQAQKESQSLQTQTRKEIEYWRELAMNECQDIQSSADNYADRVLDNLEHQLSEILKIIQQSRQGNEEQ